MILYGAKATAYIKYDGDLESLSNILSEYLYLPKFDMETDMDPPHELFGSCEALGCEMWLNKSTDTKEYNYEYSFETEMSARERDPNCFYDISPWLVSHLRRIAKLDVCTVKEFEEKYS